MSQQSLAYDQIINFFNNLNNPNVHVEAIGKSVQGKDILCAVISEDPRKYGISYCKDQYEELKNNKKPFSTSSMSERKIPIVINASIHGHETVGTQAVLDLVNYLISIEKAEVQELLERFIFLCVVCANPDGLDDGTRCNKNGFDLNRDFIFQTQPETQAIVKLIKTCNPIILFDLHGYISTDKDNIGLIEPCTVPHNPNYEYDLYIKWALPMAKGMEKFIQKKKDYFTSKYYKDIKGVCIPYRDLSKGWDDYSPTSTAMYSMLHGAIGITIEAPTRGNDGIRWMVNAILGACHYLKNRRKKILYDYHTFLQRGINKSHPNHPKNFFPSAYIFPKPDHDCNAMNKLVEHLLYNGVDVDITLKKIIVDDQLVPKGSYIIYMNQAKAILANTLLFKGDKDFPLKMTDLCVWCLPLLWGVESIATSSPIAIQTKKVFNVSNQSQISKTGPYEINPFSMESLRLIQKLLLNDVKIYQSNSGNIIIDDEGKDWIRSMIKAAGISANSVDNQAIQSSKVWRTKKIGIIYDGGLFYKQSHAGLKMSLLKLGYQVKEIHPRELTNKKTLMMLDVLIYNGFEHLFLLKSQLKDPYKQYVLASNNEYNACRDTISHFLSNGGRFIAIGAGPSKVARKMLKLTNLTINISGWNDNAIVQVDYHQNPITNGYSQKNTGFVYRPVWYTNTDNMEVLASFSSSTPSVIAGYWPDFNKAKGLPVIIKDKNLDVILIGLEICHRAQPDYLFRLLVNAIHA
ncbi:M14 family zinc carboxypeptidase [Sporosarcina siberiensis]|uniref:M14 family zinc carboxypeptidase n=1 Tax=Sporosarcina siberiensis TaxID=1365606 RepID=A0ABW4SET2_9BACL